MSKVIPIGDRVLIKQQVDEPVTSTSGIIIHQIEEKKKNLGVVVGVGNGDKIVKYGISEGNVVIFEGWGGEAIEEGLIEEKNYLIISVDKIIAKYER